jgi:hypothetical protein
MFCTVSIQSSGMPIVMAWQVQAQARLPAAQVDTLILKMPSRGRVSVSLVAATAAVRESQ